jgi:hypothetical protein
MFRWYQNAVKCYVYLSDVAMVGKACSIGGSWCSVTFSTANAWQRASWKTRRHTKYRRLRWAPRNQRRRAMGAEPALEDLDGDSRRLTQGKAQLHSEQGKAQLHSDCVPAQELGSCEIYELPAVEPVGSELRTPRDEAMKESSKERPLPLSPLPLLFAMAELRDKRAGHNPPKHNTFYHPWTMCRSFHSQLLIIDSYQSNQFDVDANKLPKAQRQESFQTPSHTIEDLNHTLTLPT